MAPVVSVVSAGVGSVVSAGAVSAVAAGSGLCTGTASPCPRGSRCPMAPSSPTGSPSPRAPSHRPRPAASAPVGRRADSRAAWAAASATRRGPAAQADSVVVPVVPVAFSTARHLAGSSPPCWLRTPPAIRGWRPPQGRTRRRATSWPPAIRSWPSAGSTGPTPLRPWPNSSGTWPKGESTTTSVVAAASAAGSVAGRRGPPRHRPDRGLGDQPFHRPDGRRGDHLRPHRRIRLTFRRAASASGRWARQRMPGGA